MYCRLPMTSGLASSSGRATTWRPNASENASPAGMLHHQHSRLATSRGYVFTRWVAASSAPIDVAQAVQAAEAALPSRATDLKLKLLERAAAVNRGALATVYQRSDIAAIISELQELSPSGGDVLGSLEGRWQLVYSSCEQFRSSPFFWAFQDGLVQSREVAAAIFKFTDWIPGATVGVAYQTFLMGVGKLVSEVDLCVFPGLRGFVVTTCRVQPLPPNALLVSVEGTKIQDSNVTQFLEGIEVPVESIVSAIRGPDSTSVRLTVAYLDADLRISRTEDGNVFVYTRA